MKSADASKRVALAALCACVAGMVLCRVFEGKFSWLVWPRAFFEAGTVGALADWFAVVALFRRPLGLPIPHTAILPNNRERVAEALANFLETSFLSREELGPRFAAVDYSGIIARFFSGHAPEIAARIVALAPPVIGGIADAEMERIIAARTRDFLRGFDAAPAAGEIIGAIAQNGRDRAIFISVLKSVRGLVGENREMVRDKIRREIPLSAELLRGIPLLKEVAGRKLDEFRDILAGAVADKAVAKIQATLGEAESDPEHPLWRSFDTRFRAFVSDLKSDPEMRAKVGALQAQLAGGPIVEDFAAKAWGEIKGRVIADCASENSFLRKKLEEALAAAARKLAESGRIREELNGFAAGQALEVALAARPRVRELVKGTISKWDPSEMSLRLERVVGADLQFIRLNGTLVGGLVGLLLHAVFVVAGMK